MKIVSQRNQNSIGLSKTFDQINTPKSESMTFWMESKKVSPILIAAIKLM